MYALSPIGRGVIRQISGGFSEVSGKVRDRRVGSRATIYAALECPPSVINKLGMC